MATLVALWLLVLNIFDLLEVPPSYRLMDGHTSAVNPPAARRLNEFAQKEFRRRIVISAAIWLVTLALAALGLNSHDPTVASWRIALDVAVGLAFVVAGFTSPARTEMRALIVLVGWSWLLASLPTVPASWHQAMLAVSLLVFPSGRISRPIYWMFVALAIPFAVGVSSQPMMAMYFLMAGGIVIATTPGRPSWIWFPVVSCLTMTLVLGGLWSAALLDPEDFDPRTGLLIYQLVLITISVGYAVASRGAAKVASRLTDSLLGEGEPTGIDGLRAVLAATLRDPGLQIRPWHDGASAYANPSSIRSDLSDRNGFEVTDGGRPLAIVVHNSPGLDDEDIRESVATAIRMTLANERLIAELDDQTEALTAARSRLMSAVDGVRETTGTRLRGDVLAALGRAVERLGGAVAKIADDEASSALTVALEEIMAANADITSLVSGLPPPGLGHGGIVPAIGDLAARSPVPFTTRLPDELIAAAEIETTLYYVASEAITNAIKHSGASQIEVLLTEDGGDILLQIADDGRGGADPTGSGLLGLTDRVAARGGRLRVESLPGAGTVITALIANRSSPTD